MIPDWPASSLVAAAVLVWALAAPAVRCCRWCRDRADRAVLTAQAWRTSRDTPHPHPPRHRRPA